MSDWSPSDTKSELLDVCAERGIDADMNMLKADIISLLEADDAALTEETTEAKPTLEPVVTPKAPPVSTKAGVLDYLTAAGERVSFEQILKDCGPEAKAELHALVKAGKVTQYKQHRSFWFAAL